MADNTINLKPLEVVPLDSKDVPESIKSGDALIKADEQSATYIGQIRSAYNNPFQDELLVKIKSLNGPPQYAVVRLNSKFDPSLLKTANKIKMGDADVELLSILDDESAHVSYGVSNVETSIGYPDDNGNIIEASLSGNKESDKKIAKQVINIIKEKIGIDLSSLSSLSEIQFNKLASQGLTEIDLALKESIFQSSISIEWNEHKTGLVIRFLLVPLPKSEKITLNNKSLNDKDQSAIKDIIKDNLQQPYTIASLEEAKKNIINAFSKHDDYYLAAIGGSNQYCQFILSPDGQLNVILNPKRNPLKYSIQVVDIDNKKNIYDSNHPAPFKVAIPQNLEGKKSTIANIQKYYSDLGYMCTVTSIGNKSDESLWTIKLAKGPRQIKMQADLAPKDTEINKHFIDKRFGCVTQTSFNEGREWLEKWYDDQGIYLNKIGKQERGNVDFSLEGNTLNIKAQLVKIKEINIVFQRQIIDSKTKQPQIEKFKLNSHDDKHNFIKEFDIQPDQYLNINKIDKSIARIKSKYPLGIDGYKIINHADGSVSLEIPVFEESQIEGDRWGGNLRGMLSGGVNWIGDQAVGNFSLGGGYKTIEGELLQLRYQFAGNEDVSSHSLSLGAKIPWITANGTSLSTGASFSSLSLTDDTQVLLGGFAMFDVPVERFSPVSFILGLGANTTFLNGEFTKAWLIPRLGIRYTEQNHTVGMSNDLGVSHEGQVFYKPRLDGTSRFNLLDNKRLFLDIKYSASLVIGDPDYNNLISPAERVPGYGFMTPENSTAQVSSRLDLMGIPTKELLLGMGGAITYMKNVNGIDRAGKFSTQDTVILSTGVALELNLPVLNGFRLLTGPSWVMREGELENSKPSWGLGIDSSF